MKIREEKQIERAEIRDFLGNEFASIFNEINPFFQDSGLDLTAKILYIGTGAGWMVITLALNKYKIITGEPETDESEYNKQNRLTWAIKNLFLS